jgi:D-aminoacyl-tRNA deacylase
MRVVFQRVERASVRSEHGQVAIGGGAVLLVCVEQGDTIAAADWMANRISHLRVFADDTGKMNRSLLDTQGSVLLVSQFTLAARVTVANAKGNRPSFGLAAHPDQARSILAHLTNALVSAGLKLEQGWFGADMKVELVNDGPVTIVLEHP